MKWEKGILLASLCIAGLQCKHDSLSLPTSAAGITSPGAFLTGTYELVSYLRTTEFGQELDESDFESISGSLILTAITVKQTVTIDEEETVIEGLHSFTPDTGSNPPTGILQFPNEEDPSDPFDGDYMVDSGDDLIINLNGTTDLDVDYVETIRWRKLSDFPQEL